MDRRKFGNWENFIPMGKEWKIGISVLYYVSISGGRNVVFLHKNVTCSW